ncbi:MAG TPA: ABC transporter permease subunit [Streptosporangiaceae bacterium]|jgi:ABC-type transport system involved in multi-copper enzyme maturation permease subunit|nr:ABC transporter permease subunit [Streptosporangiaceae bacterium]
MTAAAVSVARPGERAAVGRIGFGPALRAEWTKFRSVRGWVIGMILAAILTIFLGIFTAANAGIGCQMNGGPVKTGKACLPYIPYGPGGEVVTDSFYFVRQPLAGNGSITARVTSLTGQHADLSNGPANSGQNVPGLADWAKAGIIIKQSTHQGSAYAAMMVTAGHGVQMQYNFTGDTAGMAGNVSAAHPRWLRLTRSGDTLTGYDSADGTNWTRVGTVQLTGLPSSVQIGMFATSPGYTVTQSSFGGSNNNSGPAQATGVFDHVGLTGAASGGTWTGTAVGGGGPIGAGPQGNGASAPPYTRSGGAFTITGSGDIAPVTPGPGGGLPTVTVEQTLVGIFIGLIVIVVVAAMFFSTEYRRGLIRTTLAATPQRGVVLAAKAVIIGAVAFVTGAIAAVVCIAVGIPRAENNGQVLLKPPLITDVRVIVGTAAVLGLAAIFAVALGAILRRSAAAITLAIVIVVMPFLLTALNVLPATVGDWLLRLTPAAGLAIEQSIPRYFQVATVTNPVQGYWPLSPYAGFGVLCLWVAGALALALVMLRRRDA